MKHSLTSILLISITAYVGLGVYIYLIQRDYIYFPVGPVSHIYEEQVFKNDNESIRVTVLNRKNRDAIIYFGGNAEAVDFNASKFSSLFQNHAVFLVKYRGYGGSTGKPEEAALYSDALHIFDRIKPEYTNISIIGRSLGSGVATLVASKRKIHKLVLITPFDSLYGIAQKAFPIYPTALLLKEKYDSYSRASTITADTLIISAEFDHIVDKEHTNRLVGQFPPSQVNHEIIRDRGHNTISDNEKYYSLLKDFFK